MDESRPPGSSEFGPCRGPALECRAHSLRVGGETLRNWLAEAGVCVTRAVRAPRSIPEVPPLASASWCRSMGCEHAWFEDRGAPFKVLAYVDDATGRLMYLRFVVPNRVRLFRGYCNYPNYRVEDG
jgi:hypothetical protein